MEVDRPLTWDHVVEARVRADRVRVCRSAGADRINLFLRPRPGPRRPLNFTGESGTNAYTRDDDCAHRSRKQGLRAHVLSPFLSNGLLLAPQKLVSRRHGVNRRDVGPKDDYTQQSRRALARFMSRWAHWSPRMRPAGEQGERGAGSASELPTRSALGLRQNAPRAPASTANAASRSSLGRARRSSPWARAPLFRAEAVVSSPQAPDRGPGRLFDLARVRRGSAN
jgi:hypothetical protein